MRNAWRRVFFTLPAVIGVLFVSCHSGEQGSHNPTSKAAVQKSWSLSDLPKERLLSAENAQFLKDDLRRFHTQHLHSPNLEAVQRPRRRQLHLSTKGEIREENLALGVAVPDPNYDIHAYAAEVAAELGTIPSFNVFDPNLSRLIPLTVDGQELPPGQHQPHGKCDRPPLLGLGGNEGQAVPYSRIGRLPGVNPTTGQVDINISWAFIARWSQSSKHRQVSLRQNNSGLIHRAPPQFDVTSVTALIPSYTRHMWIRLP